MRKWIVSLVGAALFILSLADVPDQFRAWRDGVSAMSNGLTGDTVRWLLAIVGLLLILWANNVHGRLFSMLRTSKAQKSFVPYYDFRSAIFQIDFSGLWAKTEPHIEVIIYAASLSGDQVTLTGVDGRLHVGAEECSLPPRLVNGPCELIERGSRYSCRIRQPLMPAMAQELAMGLSNMNLSTKDGRVYISCSTIRWVGTVQTTFGRIALPNRIVSDESVLVRGPIRESDANKVLWRVEPQFVSQVHYNLQDSSLRSQPT